MKVYSVFRSLQGEGLAIGAPTVFIRTSGCPLRCAYCDTKHAYVKGKEMSLDTVMRKVKRFKTSRVCLTGGEPLAQKESSQLVKLLVDAGYSVVLETNGAMPLDELPCVENLTVSMDIKCPSSGEADKMLFENIELLGPTDQLKFVLSDDKDYRYAKAVLVKHRPKCEVIFTPVGGLDLRPLAEKVLADGLEVRVLPQLHKLIWGDEDDR